jgi:hypothetical protein
MELVQEFGLAARRVVAQPAMELPRQIIAREYKGA